MATKPAPRRMCSYMAGENIAPRSNAEAKALIGKRVMYLQSSDIDRSGRNYIWPKTGNIAAVKGRNIAMDDPSNFTLSISSLAEMVELKRFSFRTEAVADVDRFRQYCLGHGVVVQFKDKRQAEGIPDVEIEMETGASLEDLRAALRKVVDSQTMLQTLRACTIAENSFERDYSVE